LDHRPAGLDLLVGPERKAGHQQRQAARQRRDDGELALNGNIAQQAQAVHVGLLCTTAASFCSWALIFRPACSAASMLISKRILSPCGTKSIAPPWVAKRGDSPTVRTGNDSIAGSRAANCASCAEPTNSICVTFASSAEAIRLTTIVRPLTLRSLTRRSSAWAHGESPNTPITSGASALAKVRAGQSTNLVKLYSNAALISYSLAGPAGAVSAP